MFSFQQGKKYLKLEEEKEDTQMLVTPEMESITNALNVEKGMVRLLAYLQREHKYSNILQLRLP